MGVNIVTTVTNSSLFIDSVLNEFRSKRVIGLDIEWNSASPTSKVATLQLCSGTRCIIIQLLHLDFIPNSLKSLLLDRSVNFVGVGITQDIAKLDRDYGLKCWYGHELGPLVRQGLWYPAIWWRRIGFADATYCGRPVNILNTDQITYATIDAYASFAIGNKLLGGNN
ncbi:hypothetical protein MKW92_005829 [Papaver armeniacum]|nr:hypothetical protein MKW92_005829 [Papaver armeniacum]